MAVITPTITTNDPHVYREQMVIIAGFSEGVHVDFADGEFAPTELLSMDQAWRDDSLIVHAHIMYQNPLQILDDILHLEADMVILHAESDQVAEALEALQENGTRTGISLLPETSVTDLQDLDIDGLFDHVLVFGGNLGYQGGEADLSLLKKIEKLRDMYPDIEIGWDGGVNKDNIVEIARAGVDVINVGSTIKNAPDPAKMYAELQQLIQAGTK